MSFVTGVLIRIHLSSREIEFSGEKVRQADVVLEADPISQKVPASELSFRVIDADGSLSMFSGDTYEELKERIPISLFEYVNDIPEFLGRFYLKTWKNVGEQEFEFTAQDLIGVLASTEFEGVFWSTPIPLELALAQVLNPVGASFSLAPELSSVPISGFIGRGYYRDALQQLLFGVASVSTARSSQLVIEPISLPTLFRDVVVLDSLKLEKQSVDLLPMVTDVELISHNYSQGTELKSIFEGFLEVGRHKITFNQPYYNISVDGPGFEPSALTTEDGTYVLTEDGRYIYVNGEYIFGPNSITLNVTTPGVVLITGYEWIDSQKVYTYREPGEFESRKLISVSSATLVSNENVLAILPKVVEYYRMRHSHKMTLLPLELSPLTKVIASAFSGSRILSTVERVEMALTGGYLTKITSRGLQPEYVLPLGDPYRRPRTGVAAAGQGMDRENMFREYA